MAMPKKGKYVSDDGIKTHYYEKGRGKTIILVHGGILDQKKLQVIGGPGAGTLTPLQNNFTLLPLINLVRDTLGTLKGMKIIRWTLWSNI